MKNGEMMTLKLTRIEVVKIRLALTHVVASLEREISDDRAFMMKLRDIVSATVDQTQFDKVLDIMRQAKQVPITGTDVPKVVELTGKHIGFGEKEGAGILSHLIAGGDLSLYGLSNAVTRFSQDVKSYDRATELEAAGYDVLTLSPAIWKSINEQAAVTV